MASEQDEIQRLKQENRRLQEELERFKYLVKSGNYHYDRLSDQLDKQKKKNEQIQEGADSTAKVMGILVFIIFCFICISC